MPMSSPRGSCGQVIRSTFKRSGVVRLSALFSFAPKERKPVPCEGRRAYKKQIERSEYERLERMSVLVLQKEAVGSAVLAARHENELAERDSGILVPQSGAGPVVIEVAVAAVGEVETKACESLRQSPCPLRRGVRALFQFSAVGLFHIPMIT